jgi:hypothetical protein
VGVGVGSEVGVVPGVVVVTGGGALRAEVAGVAEVAVAPAVMLVGPGAVHAASVANADTVATARAARLGRRTWARFVDRPREAPAH